MDHETSVLEKAIVDYIEEYKATDDQKTTPSMPVLLIVGSIVIGSLFVDLTLSSHITIFTAIAVLAILALLAFYAYKTITKNLKLEKLANIIIDNIDDAVKVWQSGYYLESNGMVLNPQMFRIASSNTEVKIIKQENEYKYKISLYSYKYQIFLEFTPSGTEFNLDIIRYDGKRFSMFLKNRELNIYNEEDFVPKDIEEELLELYNKIYESSEKNLKEIIQTLRNIMKKLYSIK